MKTLKQVVLAMVALSMMGSIQVAWASKLVDQSGVDLPLGERSMFSERAIAERLKRSGDLCVEGEECDAHMGGAPEATVAAGPAEPRSGEEVYNAACMACHLSGAMAAPILGDAGAWAPRIAQGADVLAKHAIEGFKMMPAKGGCVSCTDEEITAAVEYIIANSQ